MYDFNEITVPFKSDFITPLCGVGYVDFYKVSEVSGLKVSAGDAGLSIDGNGTARDLYVPWSRLPSSYTDIACKVFDACPEANCVWVTSVLKLLQPRLCKVITFTVLIIYVFVLST
ncbi:phage/plasmid replication protein, II/X family [Vibrio parahaemolyticus]|uniref:phage/plasmid replication protein, II/X family n=1 Tax=Vibrio parahaemolyticus TaxID=670 RepID=UPI001331B7CF